MSLSGLVAVITGVSRRRGIGYAIASRLAAQGASLFTQHWAPHDQRQQWGADDLEEVRNGLREQLRDGAESDDASIDLSADDGPEALIGHAVERFGHLDILICNQAMSGNDGTLEQITAADLDLHWRTNARATLLATKAFAAQHDGRPGGRVIWMTSGQQLGPMSDEIAYVASKAALAGAAASVSDWLADRGIVMNTVNPGPVNTGYLDPGVLFEQAVIDAVAARFPGRRIGEPDDPARLIAWLVSDEGRWVVGQVLNTEGGFRR